MSKIFKNFKNNLRKQQNLLESLKLVYPNASPECINDLFKRILRNETKIVKKNDIKEISDTLLELKKIKKRNAKIRKYLGMDK